MAGSSGTYNQGIAIGAFSGNPVPGGWGVPMFYHQKTTWGTEEQVLLDNGLNNYSSDVKIVQYSQIAVELKNKTVRDVAFRCRWMAASSLAIQSSLPYAQGMTSNINNDSLSHNAVTGATHQLIEQNDWVLKQISANLVTRQMGDNICLLSQARDNIIQILSNLNMCPTMKNMPPLPKLDEELAKFILSTELFRIQ